MNPEIMYRLRRSFWVLVGAGGSAFLTMLIVQLLMGGIRSPEIALGKSFMIGFGLAMFIFLLPGRGQNHYPWQ